MPNVNILTDEDIDAFVKGDAEAAQAGNVMDYLMHNPVQAARVGTMIEVYRRENDIVRARNEARRYRTGLFDAA